MRAQCAVCMCGIYGACLKWMLPELSFSDCWSRGTKLWERDWALRRLAVWEQFESERTWKLPRGTSVVFLPGSLRLRYWLSLSLARTSCSKTDKLRKLVSVKIRIEYLFSQKGGNSFYPYWSKVSIFMISSTLPFFYTIYIIGSSFRNAHFLCFFFSSRRKRWKTVCSW